MNIGNLKSLSVEALVDLRKNVDKLLSSKLANAKKELQLKLDYLDGIFGGAGRGGRRGKRKIEAKYRGPNGETWAGRGMRPRWLAALIEEGHKIEEFMLPSNGAAPSRKAAPKKARRKKAARPRAKKAAAAA